MYTVIFKNGNKTILQKNFSTQREAEDFVFTETHEQNCEYQIHNTEDDDITDLKINGSKNGHCNICIVINTL